MYVIHSPIMFEDASLTPLLWRQNGHNGVSNHQLHDCLLNRLFNRRSKKPTKLRVTGLCVGNSPVTGTFPAQMASHAENVFIWWRHHAVAIVWWDLGKPVNESGTKLQENTTKCEPCLYFLECPVYYMRRNRKHTLVVMMQSTCK